MKLLPPKRCNPTLLVIISLFGPGMGQMITGRCKFGTSLILIAFLIPLSFFYSGFIWTFPGIILFTTLQIGLYLFSLCEAVIYGLRHEECQRPSLKVFIPYLLLIRITMRLIMLSSPFTTFQVPSRSMVPTLEVGDRFSSDRHYYRTHSPQRNEVAVFTIPGSPNKLVKRIIGLPGDTLELREDSLFLNGHLQKESHPTYNPEGRFVNFSPYIVPENSVFVLGDNRNNSNDSRYYGPIHQNKLAGKPVMIFFSRHTNHIGKEIE